jgi:hypothetical protein
MPMRISFTQALLVLALHRTTQAGSSCEDLQAAGQLWRSSTGSRCEDYGALKLCTQEGKAGDGWDASFGTLEDWATAGLDATQVTIRETR